MGGEDIRGVSLGPMDLVTGGTGLVGSHVLFELRTRGRTVRAIHRGKGSERVRRLFRYYRPDDGEALFAGIEWMPCDLLDVQGLADAMTGVDHVHHCAAQVSFDPRDTRTLFAVNIGGTGNVVNTALAAGVHVLVHVSSTGATGTAPAGQAVNEDMPFVRDRTTSAYGVSKYEGELEVQRGVAEGLRAVIVNPSVVLGPGDVSRSSLTILRRLQRGSLFYPSGSMGFVDARDVAWCMAELAQQGANGERYIVSGPTASYRELFTEVCTAYGRPAPRFPAPAWALGLAWRLERLRGAMLGGRPLITRSTVRNGLSHRRYDASKVEAATGIRFRGLREMVRNASAFERM